MTEAYAAGLIDGEGSITLPRYDRSEFRYPTVSVSSTTKELVDFLQQNYGGYISSKAENRRPNHKKAYQWSVVRNAAIGFLERVLPFMREPEKIRRAKLIVEEYRTVTPRNGRYSDTGKETKLDFQRRFLSTSTHVNAV